MRYKKYTLFLKKKKHSDSGHILKPGNCFPKQSWSGLHSIPDWVNFYLISTAEFKQSKLCGSGNQVQNTNTG